MYRTQSEAFELVVPRKLPHWSGGGESGQVMALGEGLAVVTGDGALLLREVQLAGKRALSAEEFARGQRDFVGSVLGKEG